MLWWDRVGTEVWELGTEQWQPWFSIWQGVVAPALGEWAPLHLGPLEAGLTVVRSQEQVQWGALQTALLLKTVQSSIAKAADSHSRALTRVLLLSFPHQVMPLRASLLEPSCSALGNEGTQLKCFLQFPSPCGCPCFLSSAQVLLLLCCGPELSVF